jgi:hypothetical protein
MALVPMLERKLLRMYNACMSIPEGKAIRLRSSERDNITSSERAALRRGLTTGIKEFKRLFKGVCNGSRCENVIRAVFAGYMDILDRILKGKALRRSQSAFLEKQSKAYPPRSRSRYLAIVKLRSKHFEQPMYKDLNATMAALEAFTGHYFAKMTESVGHIVRTCEDAVAAEAAKLPARSRARVISAGTRVIADIARSSQSIRTAGKEYKKHMLTCALRTKRRVGGGGEDNENAPNARTYADITEDEKTEIAEYIATNNEEGAFTLERRVSAQNIQNKIQNSPKDTITTEDKEQLIIIHQDYEKRKTPVLKEMEQADMLRYGDKSPHILGSVQQIATEKANPAGDEKKDKEEEKEKSGNKATILTFGLLGLGVVTQSAPLLFFGLLYAAMGINKITGDHISDSVFQNNMEKLRESRIGNFTFIMMIWKFAEMKHEEGDAVKQITGWCNKISDSYGNVDEMMRALKYVDKADRPDNKEVLANLKTMYNSLFDYGRNENTGQPQNKCTFLLDAMKQTMTKYVHNMYDVAAGLWVIDAMNSDKQKEIMVVINKQYDAAQTADKSPEETSKLIDKYSPFTFTTVYKEMNKAKGAEWADAELKIILDELGLIGKYTTPFSQDKAMLMGTADELTLENLPDISLREDLRQGQDAPHFVPTPVANEALTTRINPTFEDKPGVNTGENTGGKRQVKRSKGSVTKPKKVYTT